MNVSEHGVTVLNEIGLMMTKLKNCQAGQLSSVSNQSIRKILMGASIGIVSKITNLNRDYGINSKGLRQFNGHYSTEDYRIPYSEFSWSHVLSNFKSDTFLLRETIVDKKRATEFATLLVDLQSLAQALGQKSGNTYADLIKYTLPKPLVIPWMIEDRTKREGDTKVWKLVDFIASSIEIKYDGDLSLTGLTGTDAFSLEIERYNLGPHFLSLLEPLFPHIQSAYNQVIQTQLKERASVEGLVSVFITKYGHHAVLASL